MKKGAADHLTVRAVARTRHDDRAEPIDQVLSFPAPRLKLVAVALARDSRHRPDYPSDPGF
jgi:hypothetical protein